MLKFPDLANKVAVVTGASGAIGRAIVEKLAIQGATVIATDIDANRLIDCFQRSEGSIETLPLDVTDSDAAKQLASDVFSRHGRLDIWINNAGILSLKQSLDISATEWRRELDINLNGTFFGAQAAALVMSKAGGGSIINLSSFAGLKARPSNPHYAVSKAAVVHLTMCLALEWGPLGIRVNAIAPGYIQTPMTDWLHSDATKLSQYLARTPLGRLGQADEIAEHILYLASDTSSFMTGNIQVVDGGVRLS
ncbi:SDR family NAD(P)-dependent oxidoreductase [Paraburkholderia tropica]|uniref:SDR family NAD(P)-dependent oxidoreductase n=1 Tax=Paraburkholderia tropica TaxID=92647 RepID=UPI0007ED6C16|nr:SDR family oxidoreductase [Paraburkholderia tropica]OBR53134.1 short-chain dehydrogenase [Paraburkholderia tropica]